MTTAKAACYVQGREGGAAWISHLAEQDYDAFPLEQRLDVLQTLVHAALEGPSVRLCLEHRLEEAQRIRKQMWEEAKVCNAPQSLPEPAHSFLQP